MKYAASTWAPKCNLRRFPDVWKKDVVDKLKFYDTKEEAIKNLKLLTDEIPKSCVLWLANDDMTYNSQEVIDDLSVYESASPAERIAGLNARLAEKRTRIQGLQERIRAAQQSQSPTRSQRVKMLQLDIQIAQLDIEKIQIRIQRTQIAAQLQNRR